METSLMTAVRKGMPIKTLVRTLKLKRKMGKLKSQRCSLESHPSWVECYLLADWKPGPNLLTAEHMDLYRSGSDKCLLSITLKWFSLEWNLLADVIKIVWGKNYVLRNVNFNGCKLYLHISSFTGKWQILQSGQTVAGEHGISTSSQPPCSIRHKPTACACRHFSRKLSEIRPYKQNQHSWCSAHEGCWHTSSSNYNCKENHWSEDTNTTTR